MCLVSYEGPPNTHRLHHNMADELHAEEFTWRDRKPEGDSGTRLAF
jgi:hypothetical protein